MTANELKYTYMEEAMSILDNEELMRKALSLLRNLKEKTFSPAKRSEREVLEEAFQSVKDLKAGKITSRPLEDLLSFDKPLAIGDKLIFEDMIHYTIVKTNMFNGIPHPSWALWNKDDQLVVYRTFGYEDYKNRMD